MSFLKCKITSGGLLLWLALYFPWTVLIWRVLVTAINQPLPLSPIPSSTLSFLLLYFSFLEPQQCQEERSGIGREDIAILKKKKKKKTATMMERAQKLNKLFSCCWFTKLLIKLYCCPYEREKSIGISELILQFLLYLRIQ